MITVRRVLPGLLPCLAVTLAAEAVQRAEVLVFGQAWLESLVLAILLGTAVRTVWTPAARWLPGIKFSAKMLLEIAIVLLGASLSAQAIAAAGPGLLVGIAAIVSLAIGFGIIIGRLLGLKRDMAILVACGNAICGNSAIAAVAPVIGASGADVAASIAFTAVLGVAVVLGLPLLAIALHLSAAQAGVFAGLTVYAVPQVLAATAPLGAVAVQIGTLVKLVRVLMLGPVVLVLSFVAPPMRAPRKLNIATLVPWFIIGFLLLATIRSTIGIPAAILPPLALVTGKLTIISMAALGLTTDLRTVAQAGARVTVAVIVALLLLGGLSLLLIRMIGVV